MLVKDLHEQALGASAAEMGAHLARAPSAGGVFVGRVCPVCAERALVMFEERGVQTDAAHTYYHGREEKPRPAQEAIRRSMQIRVTSMGTASLTQTSGIESAPQAAAAPPPRVPDREGSSEGEGEGEGEGESESEGEGEVDVDVEGEVEVEGEGRGS